MPRLTWTPPALRDIQRLYRFIAMKNPDAARGAVRAIKAGVRSLARHPDSGRLVQLDDFELRERVIDFGRDGYVVLYQHEGEAVYLLAVRHGREAGF